MKTITGWAIKVWLVDSMSNEKPEADSVEYWTQVDCNINDPAHLFSSKNKAEEGAKCRRGGTRTRWRGYKPVKVTITIEDDGLPELTKKGEP